MTAVYQTRIEFLPEVSGRYTENAPLGEKSWFRCGGKADVVFKPADVEDLQYFLKNTPPEVPISVFGALSNTIIRDGGVRGVVIRFGREFSKIETHKNIVTAGALALDANVATISADNGIAELEFLSGIPGSVGGALRMNAGCYGAEVKDVLVECEAIDRAGNIITLSPNEMGMEYRHVNVPKDYIFLKAMFKGVMQDPDRIKEKIRDIKNNRERSQPIREKTGGSTFANPSAKELSQAGLSADMKVWQLIDGVNGRGLKIGGAQMSDKHCNFMLNTGNACASDLEGLGEEIRSRVAGKYGITLRWEIRRIGEL